MKGTKFITIGSWFRAYAWGYQTVVEPTDPTVCKHTPGEYVNDATGTFELRDASGTPVPGGSGVLSYVPESSGIYVGVIPATVTATLTVGAKYTIVMKMYENGVLMATESPQYVARVSRGTNGDCC